MLGSAALTGCWPVPCGPQTPEVLGEEPDHGPGQEAPVSHLGVCALPWPPASPITVESPVLRSVFGAGSGGEVGVAWKADTSWYRGFFPRQRGEYICSRLSCPPHPLDSASLLTPLTGSQPLLCLLKLPAA